MDAQSRSLTHQTQPSLQELVESDRNRWERFDQTTAEFLHRVECFRKPIVTWTNIVAKRSEEARHSLRSCRMRDLADHSITLNAEGFIDESRISWGFKDQYAEDLRRRFKWIESTSVSSQRLSSHSDVFS